MFQFGGVWSFVWGVSPQKPTRVGSAMVPKKDIFVIFKTAPKARTTLTAIGPKLVPRGTLRRCKKPLGCSSRSGSFDRVLPVLY